VACACTVVLCALVSASPASGQDEWPRLRLGAGGSASLLVGDASDFLDGGFGGHATVEMPIDARRGRSHSSMDSAHRQLLRFVESSRRDDVRAVPEDVQDVFGSALLDARYGDMPQKEHKHSAKACRARSCSS
jgi:hypothetical protein